MTGDSRNVRRFSRFSDNFSPAEYGMLDSNRNYLRVVNAPRQSVQEILRSNVFGAYDQENNSRTNRRLRDANRQSVDQKTSTSRPRMMHPYFQTNMNPYMENYFNFNEIENEIDYRNRNRYLRRLERENQNLQDMLEHMPEHDQLNMPERYDLMNLNPAEADRDTLYYRRMMRNNKDSDQASKSQTNFEDDTINDAELEFKSHDDEHAESESVDPYALSQDEEKLFFQIFNSRKDQGLDINENTDLSDSEFDRIVEENKKYLKDVSTRKKSKKS